MDKTMKTILVTGGNGQLGSELLAISKNSPHTFIFTDYLELDITKEKTITTFFENHTIDYVINCAAYTAVDKAEEDLLNATLLNTQGIQFLAHACSSFSIPLIHISTDYVFDGKSHIPYVETSLVNPQSVYGTTKLQGEQYALETHSQTIIIRTSWLYSSFGNNFVKTMIRLGLERESLSVIYDQIGTPTYARDLAEAILTIIDGVEEKRHPFTAGIYHYSNEGVCSWFDFAKEIHALWGITCSVIPIETTQYPTPAKRPHYSVLNKSKIKSTYGIHIPYWKDSLQNCIAILKQTTK